MAKNLVFRFSFAVNGKPQCFVIGARGGVSPRDCLNCDTLDGLERSIANPR